MVNYFKGFLLFKAALKAWQEDGFYSTAYTDYDRADDLTIEHSAFNCFDSLLSAWHEYRPSLDVSVRGKLELANTYDAAQKTRGDSRRAFRYGTPYKHGTCQRHDSLIPQPWYSNTGDLLGFTMPRMTQAQIAASPGIQGWSAPEFETRTR